jgi:hypothetical protein
MAESLHCLVERAVATQAIEESRARWQETRS